MIADRRRDRAFAGSGAAFDEAEVDGYGLWTLVPGLGFDIALNDAPVDRARATLRRHLRALALLDHGSAVSRGAVEAG